MDLAPLKKLNIHFFGAEASAQGHKACYFLSRPFGNVLIFGLNYLPIDKTFIMSKGGVYKQVLTHPDQITPQGKKFFTTFGCPAVFPAKYQKDIRDSEIRYEFQENGIHEKSYSYLPFGNGHWVFLKHADRGVLFTDETLLINQGVWQTNERVLDEQLNAIKDLEVDIVLPRFFKGPSPYQAVTQQIFHNKLQSLI